MPFSIITPSFRSGGWLKLCIASVADQSVDLEHIVQDAGSDDGTLDWLPQDRRVKAFVEKDEGMYDAVNRGLRRSSGDILAHLNCDEQYLPGALPAVARYFERHPEIEVVFGDAVVVDLNGNYLCHRKTVLPTRRHSMLALSLATLTCATFFRRSLIERRQLFFDARYRDLGDTYWILSLFKHRVPMGLLGRFTSVFTNSGQNMGRKPNARREALELYRAAPAWMRAIRPVFAMHYRLRKLLAGHYSQRPFEYSIYTAKSPDTRVRFQAAHPTGIWKDPA